MPASVKARRTFESVIPKTEITVKIPAGTVGTMTEEVRGNIVMVQFDVPGLGPLRVNRDDLDIEDELDGIVRDMEHLLSDDDYPANAEKLLLRALQIIATDENRALVERLVNLYVQLRRFRDARAAKAKRQEGK